MIRSDVTEVNQLHVATTSEALWRLNKNADLNFN